MANKRVIDVMRELFPGVDFAGSAALVDDRVLDSLAMISLVAELEDAFDVTIPAIEVTAENFNSVEAIQALVDRLSE